MKIEIKEEDLRTLTLLAQHGAEEFRDIAYANNDVISLHGFLKMAYELKQYNEKERGKND